MPSTPPPRASTLCLLPGLLARIFLGTTAWAKLAFLLPRKGFTQPARSSAILGPGRTLDKSHSPATFPPAICFFFSLQNNSPLRNIRFERAALELSNEFWYIRIISPSPLGAGNWRWAQFAAFSLPQPLTLPGPVHRWVFLGRGIMHARGFLIWACGIWSRAPLPHLTRVRLRSGFCRTCFGGACSHLPLRGGTAGFFACAAFRQWKSSSNSIF